MKEFKIDLHEFKGKIREVVSEAIQKKAFGLGYEWNGGGKEAFYKKSPYLFLADKITHFGTEDVSFFEAHGGDEISAEDFLDFNPEEPELKPFDHVLVRDFDEEEWVIDIFEEKDRDKPYRYQCLRSFYHQCIPYEGNEHLLGTTGEPEWIKK